ncbi:MAG: Asp-tRNA(Asn)/Glu-tRNA(Gln) amidotransferase subunit GatB, partial [bacterium]|nr:Asp-tRNA(Asn)/Glu-tRNA(Gln) amidotransferase subunit GatB [bacterium]
VEVNLSMAGVGAKKLGTKVEVKNINSFKAVEGAIAYEIKRQTELLDEGKGDLIKQETRGWDDVKRITVSQRSKENANDYRYFPEPDIPSLPTAGFNIPALKDALPELPAAKRVRFTNEYGITEAQAALLVDEKALAEYFEEAVSELRALTPDASVSTAFNYLTSDLKGLLNEHGLPGQGEGFEALSAGGGSSFGGKVSPEHLAHLVAFIHEGKITSRQAKDMLREMHETGMDPEELLASRGGVASNESLEAVVAEVLKENIKAADDLKNGKVQSLQFLIGQAMKKTKGSAQPETLKALFMGKIGKG